MGEGKIAPYTECLLCQQHFCVKFSYSYLHRQIEASSVDIVDNRNVYEESFGALMQNTSAGF